MPQDFTGTVSIGMEKDRFVLSSGSDSTPIADPSICMGPLEQFTETVHLQPGMRLYIVRVPADVSAEFVFDISNGPFTFECWHKGTMDYTYRDENDTIGKDRAREGQIIFGSTCNEHGKAVKKSGLTVEMVKLVFDPSILIMTLKSSMRQKQIAHPEYIFKKSSRPRFHFMPTPPATETVIRNILNCHHKSPLRQFVLANKAHELFYSIIMELFVSRTSSDNSVLQPGDVDKFYSIKDIIESNLNSPLSHSQIARMAGINEFKLKTGFKEMFGTTVYGYMLDKRMSKARSLLENGTHSVSDAAWEVGYTNVSHFISIFRKFYGVTPGKFLLSIKQRLKDCAVKSSV